MILPPTQQLVSCSFRLTDQVEFQELWHGPELREKARVLVVCGSGKEVESECSISLLVDSNREHNTPLPWSHLFSQYVSEVQVLSREPCVD